jgi:RNA polymerase sigma-70 factor (ECF subfamily)
MTTQRRSRGGGGELVSETTAGDMVEHREAVRRFVLRHVGNEAIADDLTQETFLRVQRSSSSYRGDAGPQSWLRAIALNIVRDHFRAAGGLGERSRDPTAPEELPSNEDGERALLASEMSACVGEYLLELPHPQYDVVALHEMEGLTHPEIASALGISVANSRVLLHRGRAALREILRRNCTLSFDNDGVPCERKPPEERC